jgi:beta-lactamase class A
LQDSKWQKLCLVAAVAFFGGAAGSHMYEHSACPESPLRLQDFACLTHEAERVLLPALEDEVRALIARKSSADTRIGMLFQRLNDGEGFSIGDEQLFVPASLLKLPVAFAIFVLDAQQVGTLEQELPYTVEQAGSCAVLAQDEVSASGLSLGQRYTIESMLRAVIVHSDNLAYCILIDHMNAESDRRTLMLRTFRELGIQDPQSHNHEDATVREYAGLFRLLYNTAYLDATGSTKLLEWLSESSYDKGIGAGVPSSVRIANKFAERVTNDETRYLHDCGIAYVGGDPYLLCVMTKGHDFADLREIISGVSSAVYSAVAAGRR